MDISHPENKFYETRRIHFEISLSSQVAELGYIDNLANSPRFRRLCRNCDSYDRTLTFSEGHHNITIRAIDEHGDSIEQNKSFMIDSRVPRISQVLPRKNTITNGSEFSLSIFESNFESASIVFNGSIFPVNSCIIDRRIECMTSLN